MQTPLRAALALVSQAQPRVEVRWERPPPGTLQRGVFALTATRWPLVLAVVLVLGALLALALRRRLRPRP